MPRRSILRFNVFLYVLAFSVPLLIAFGPQSLLNQPNSQGNEFSSYDPFAFANAQGSELKNFEATVPVQCYTKTQGIANPCWTCHTQPHLPNEWVDWDLQESYAFSDFALTNRWTNLFKDRSTQIAAISDEEVLAYIRQDNYSPLLKAIGSNETYTGYRPDLDFERGFDEAGFALDNSGWRAFRYKPFPGTFWPTNGNTDDVMIRLPKNFQSIDGIFNREIYKINLALLETAIASPPNASGQPSTPFPVEPLNEALAQFDLDGNGKVAGYVSLVRLLPSHYLGDAIRVPLEPYVYPKGTEFLHSVRYVDPDRPGRPGIRMKELRYSKKVHHLDSWARSHAYEKEYNEKEEGSLPHFAGSAQSGLRNRYGWQLQGFIEDQKGRLRLQTLEEHQFCMGCHGSLGVTVDHSFSLPRKVPGKTGWGYQELNGIKDTPQWGHSKGEVLTYFERVGGGDEFRANQEILLRFFKDGKLDPNSLHNAYAGGKADITDIILPSRERAMTLNKAYMTVVREQRFDLGRDVLIDPIENVHQAIKNGTTDLGKSGKVFLDGTIWLDWQLTSGLKKP